MEDRVKELNHKLQEKPENLHSCNSTTTSMTLSTGLGTSVNIYVGAYEDWVFNIIHHARDAALLMWTQFRQVKLWFLILIPHAFCLELREIQ